MDFPPEVAEKLLVACHRRCCLCHRFCGTHMEIHHIEQDADGGSGTEDNGIPLCFDCHAEVNAYNDRHPRGRKYRPAELKKHRATWFAICAAPPWGTRPFSIPPEAERTAELLSAASPDSTSTSDSPPHMKQRLVDLITSSIKVEVPTTAEQLVGTLALEHASLMGDLYTATIECLQSPDEEIRWKAARVMEELVLWTPELVRPSDLLGMASDEAWPIRSSAAICYYHLAHLNPVAVPIDILYKLSSQHEDWYVFTPAFAALLRLVRTRPSVIDLFVRGIKSENQLQREYAAEAVLRLTYTDWYVVADELLAFMRSSNDPRVRQTAIQAAIIGRSSTAAKNDFAPFSPFYVEGSDDGATRGA